MLCCPCYGYFRHGDRTHPIVPRRAFFVLRRRLELNRSHLCPLPPRLVVVVNVTLVHDDHIYSCAEDPPQMRHAEIFHVRPVTVAKHLLLATQPTRTIGRVVPAPNTLLRQSVAMVEVVDELYGAKRRRVGLRTDCAHIHTVHPTHKLIHLALNTQQHSALHAKLSQPSLCFNTSVCPLLTFL